MPSDAGSMMTSTTSCVQIMPYSPKIPFMTISSGMFKSPCRLKVSTADSAPFPMA